MNLYKLVMTGRVDYVVAKTRRKAIESYCNLTGANPEFVRKHCKVVNYGVYETSSNFTKEK